jgi:hypothetical protein
LQRIALTYRIQLRLQWIALTYRRIDIVLGLPRSYLRLGSRNFARVFAPMPKWVLPR